MHSCAHWYPHDCKALIALKTRQGCNGYAGGWENLPSVAALLFKMFEVYCFPAFSYYEGNTGQPISAGLACCLMEADATSVAG